MLMIILIIIIIITVLVICMHLYEDKKQYILRVRIAQMVLLYINIFRFV